MTRNEQGEAVKNIVRKCWRKGCTADAEHRHMGIPLCMVHWLRVRVSYNLAKIARDEKHAA